MNPRNNHCKINNKTITILQIVSFQLLKIGSSFKRSEIHYIVALAVITELNFLLIAGGLIYLLEILNLARNGTEIFLISFFWSVCLYFMNGLSFLIIVSIVYFQLKALNNSISQCSKNNSKNQIKEFLRETFKMYDLIVDIIDAVSSYFVLNCLVFNLCFVYFSTYFLFTAFALFQDTNLKMFYFFLTILLWFLLYFPFFLYIGIFSSFIQKEASKVANTVHILTLDVNDPKMSRVCEHFMLQTSHRMPVLMKFGLFAINWKFAFSVVGSIFSYAIILIQFFDISKG